MTIQAPCIVTTESCNTVFPRDMVFLRNIRINTLHKGDDDNNNNNNNNSTTTTTTNNNNMKYIG